MKPQQFSVCVYCGSRAGNDQEYGEIAEAIGVLFAQYRIAMVYGGGSVGLMGIAARACLAAGGTVTGVITEQLEALEVGLDSVTEKYLVPDMHARKLRMFDLSDGFIALPGGSGTLDEIAEILSWRQLGLHDKPCILLNHRGFWEPLTKLLAQMHDHGFLSQSGRDYFQLAGTPAQALSLLNAQIAPANRPAN
ncbi:MAG TPA: TIGR00730 family Rossman fold protein [Alphaproteobacteria bacterium]|nr:TIGR00730 family Rossman fold protein [Alphaproteobacteria bacterium]